MNHSFHYTGLFFDAKELWQKISPYRREPLETTIDHPHVTFAYRPEEADRSFFGTEILVTITGYGNNGRNEGVLVSLCSDVPELQSMIDEIEIPHITISVARDAEAVATRFLHFKAIPEIQITGKYGGFTNERSVILQKE